MQRMQKTVRNTKNKNTKCCVRAPDSLLFKSVPCSNQQAMQASSRDNNYYTSVAYWYLALLRLMQLLSLAHSMKSAEKKRRKMYTYAHLD